MPGYLMLSFNLESKLFPFHRLKELGIGIGELQFIDQELNGI